MWNIKLKATNKQTKTHRHRQQHDGDQREKGRERVKGNGYQIYGDGGLFYFG